MKKFYLGILIVCSIATRLFFFGYPQEVVFDEIHYGTFVSHYLKGEAFYDIHPPLGKLILYAGAKIGGVTPGFEYGEIGTPYTDMHYVWLRLLPLIAGISLPILVYFLSRKLGLSPFASWLAGMILVFENSSIVQSQFILIDNFLLVFGFSSLLLYLESKKRQSHIWLTAAAALAGAALSVKWTGAAFLLLMIFLEIRNMWRRRQPLTQVLQKAGILILIPIIVYMSVFALHFVITSQRPNLTNFIDLNTRMNTGSRTVVAHPYSSAWYSWPIATKPILYWSTTTSTESGRYVFFFGNVFVYVGGAISVLLLTIGLFAKKFFKNREAILIILTGFFVNWLPFAFILRPMFLYHYLAALLFSILAIGACFDAFVPERHRKIVGVCVLSLVALSFCYIAFVTYGFSIIDALLDSRFWFTFWHYSP